MPSPASGVHPLSVRQMRFRRHPSRAARRTPAQGRRNRGARFDIARQVRTFARCIDLDRAVDIEVADLSVEPFEAPLVTGTGEIAGDAIGRRVGKREACEIVELGQVRAREHNIDGERAEIERPRQRAVGDDAGVARAHIALEAIGLVRVDIEQRIACQLQCEGPPIELPLSVKVKRIFSTAFNLLRGKASVEHELLSWHRRDRAFPLR